MSSDPITRPEFENALTGLRREIQAMGEHIGSDLGLIRAQLQSLLDTHHQEGREVGELKIRVEYNESEIKAIHESRRQEKSNRWGLYVAIGIALLGQLLTFLLRSK